MLQDGPNVQRLGDEGDDPHLDPSLWAGQRKCLVDARQQYHPEVAGGRPPDRLGRILRLKEDDRDARFVLPYVTGSAEDPKTGFQDEFIQEMMEIANDVAYFDMDSDPDDVTDFLAP